MTAKFSLLILLDILPVYLLWVRIWLCICKALASYEITGVFGSVVAVAVQSAFGSKMH
jgi:hypothetical protein